MGVEDLVLWSPKCIKHCKTSFKFSVICWVWDIFSPTQLVYPDVMEQVECNSETELSLLPLCSL